MERRKEGRRRRAKGESKSKRKRRDKRERRGQAALFISGLGYLAVAV